MTVFTRVMLGSLSETASRICERISSWLQSPQRRDGGKGQGRTSGDENKRNRPVHHLVERYPIGAYLAAR